MVLNYCCVMDNRAAIRQFLVTRRAKLRPEDTGLPEFGGVRRVPGLRREEVALVARGRGGVIGRGERGVLHLTGTRRTSRSFRQRSRRPGTRASSKRGRAAAPI